MEFLSELSFIMQVIGGLITYIADNPERVVTRVSNIVFLFSVIAAVTPTPKDDSLAKKLYSIIDILAINIIRAKDK